MAFFSTEPSDNDPAWRPSNHHILKEPSMNPGQPTHTKHGPITRIESFARIQTHLEAKSFHLAVSVFEAAIDDEVKVALQAQPKPAPIPEPADDYEEQLVTSILKYATDGDTTAAIIVIEKLIQEATRRATRNSEATR